MFISMEKCVICRIILCFLMFAAGAGGQEAQFFEPGEAWKYQLHTTVLLNEKGEDMNDVGFLISGNVLVESVWGNNNYERLLRLELQSPKLYIRSRKAPTPDGFVVHTSNLDAVSNTPFLIQWSHGKIHKIHLQKDDPLAVANFKKGIASVFQFQLLDQEVNETDASGHCAVTYVSAGPNEFRKIKRACVSSDLPYVNNPEPIMGTTVESTRATTYETNSDNKYIKAIKSGERHAMFVQVKEDVGNKVETFQTLTFTETKSVKTYEGNSFDDVVEQIGQKEGVVFTQETLLTEREIAVSEEIKGFTNAVNDNRDYLKGGLLGTLPSAKVLAKLIAVGRQANKDDITKALGSKKNQKILHQLYDILGYVQTLDAHEAAMKKLHFDNAKHEEFSERYLWGLSMTSQPNPQIIVDLLNRFKKTENIPEKVKETLVLTIASMTHRLSKLDVYQKNKVQSNVKEAILNALDYAKGDERHMFFRALKNLKSEETVPVLLGAIINGTLKEGVLAFKALASFPPAYWDPTVFKTSLTTFLQLDKIHDSSSRAIAADILLESQPSDETLKTLIYFLLSNDKTYELKQYVLQRLKMIADEDTDFKNRMWKIVKSDSWLNNYSILGPRGLSTALTRSFMQTQSSNGSLVSIQEMSGGVVKRGIVNIMVDKNGESQEIFSLGIFSGGLASYLSSDTDVADPDEVATAGLELTVLGTQIRPFTFFSGQGELMGHVWSGTASEKTTAYQALAMLHDHLEYLRLGPGFIAELDLKGAASFDLSGKIEISLWNRNAVSVVQKSAGIVVVGLMRVDTSFVRSQVEFSTSIEPKLDLKSDIDFSAGSNLCMRLSQPDSEFRHNIFKIERIPGSKHRLRKVKYKKNIVPGRTYALNKKNNDMCSAMFK